MTNIDFRAPAALYTARGYGRKAPLVFRRFDTTAEAIRHAVERVGDSAALAYVETDSGTIDRAQLRELYDSPDFPRSRTA